MLATLLQLFGLAGLTAAATLELGVAGAVAGAAVAALYVGVAMER